MSRTVRKQLMEIADTLQKANELLANLLEGTPTEEMINLLTDCQNCAITMGNKIETVYGNGTASVHTLEEYCESIFQISQNLDNLPECMGIYEASKSQLIIVREQLEKEIPDKLEVAFMPYKASMWDSLESVYLAAREDEKCEAYVVPIPYFDRKADKSLGEMHYEGAQYPKNIPITDWEQYNFEERMPDVIYIHNAYDDMNLVTCVHPRFFSSNLKKYTEKLVYIPYFVLEEIDPRDQKKIDGIKHFCFLPGIVNADKVIVQSENMRQIYMNEYAKVIETAGGLVDRKQLEKKFLGTGSPKFDKVLNTRKEDLEIPEEWLEIIQKPDGSWKKIIFYNTSVTALLQHGEKMLEKMKDVFRIFKENQNEVALLWRPHPLIKTTIESMKPELWEEYEKIVEQYKEEGWGIYDDTADMDRAVVLSDGYYGDQSSVVQLYQKTGKPVMIQDAQIVESSSGNAWMDAIVDNGENIWFSLGNYNGLYCYNKLSREASFKGFFPEEELLENRLFGNAVIVGRKIFFSPVRAKGIAIYDMETEIFKRIPINCFTGKELRCFNIVQWKNFLYFISTSYQTLIIKLDLLSEELQYFQYELGKIDLSTEFLGREVAIYNNSFFLTVLDKPLIIEFDLLSQCFRKYELPSEYGFSTICCKNGVFFLGGKQHIAQWNLYDNTLELYPNFPDGFGMQIESGKKKHEYVNGFCEKSSTWKFPFSRSVIIGDDLFLLSSVMNMSVLFNINTKEMKKCIICEDEENFHENRRLSRLQYLFLNYCGNGVIYVFSTRKCSLYEIDIYSGQKRKIEMLFEVKEEVFSKLMRAGKGIIYEAQNTFRLNGTIQSIFCNRHAKMKKAENSIGDKIGKAMRER